MGVAARVPSLRTGAGGCNLSPKVGWKKPHPRLLRQFDTRGWVRRLCSPCLLVPNRHPDHPPKFGHDHCESSPTLLYAVLSASSTVPELSQNDIDGSVQNFELPNWWFRHGPGGR